MPNEITQKAMCVFVKDGRTLLSGGWDENKDFFRPLGGHIEEGEKPGEAVKREIMEELGSEIENLKFFGSKKFHFTYHGQEMDEEVFIFYGNLSKQELYEKNPIKINDNGREFVAEWVPIPEALSAEKPLYPELARECLASLTG